MGALMEHQTSFTCFMMGGPVSFSDSHLKAVHKHMSLTQVEWNEFMRIINIVLVDFEMEKDDIKIFLSNIESKKDLIIISESE